MTTTMEMDIFERDLVRQQPATWLMALAQLRINVATRMALTQLGTNVARQGSTLLEHYLFVPNDRYHENGYITAGPTPTSGCNLGDGANPN
jgi:hypothetical protein